MDFNGFPPILLGWEFAVNSRLLDVLSLIMLTLCNRLTESGNAVALQGAAKWRAVF
jgi:hypothetical protein